MHSRLRAKIPGRFFFKKKIFFKLFPELIIKLLMCIDSGLIDYFNNQQNDDSILIFHIPYTSNCINSSLI